MSRRMLYRMVWVPSTLALFGLLAFFATRSGAVQTPGPLTTYTSSDGVLTVQYPSNWKTQSMALHDTLTSVKFRSGSSLGVAISADLSGSLMADIDKSSSQMTDNLLGSLPGGEQIAGKKRKSPLEKLHEAKAEEMTEDYKGYREGTTTHRQIAGFDALLTEFTYEVPRFPSSRPMCGLRATVLAQDRRVSVVCYCPRNARLMLMPVFAAMLDSLRIGQAGGTR